MQQTGAARRVEPALWLDDQDGLQPPCNPEFHKQKKKMEEQFMVT